MRYRIRITWKIGTPTEYYTGTLQGALMLYSLFNDRFEKAIKSAEIVDLLG